MLDACFQSFLCSTNHHSGASHSVFLHTFTPWVPHCSDTQASQQGHIHFPSSISLLALGNKEEKRGKKDTCKVLQLNKHCFAGLLLSSTLLPEKQVSHIAFNWEVQPPHTVAVLQQFTEMTP